eukprot:346053-Amphidinium_carterae.1
MCRLSTSLLRRLVVPAAEANSPDGELGAPGLSPTLFLSPRGMLQANKRTMQSFKSNAKSQGSSEHCPKSPDE